MARRLVLSEINNIFAYLALQVVSTHNVVGARPICTVVVEDASGAIDVIDFAVEAALPFKSLEIAHKAANDGFVSPTTASCYVGSVVLNPLLDVAAIGSCRLQENGGVAEVESGSITLNFA